MHTASLNSNSSAKVLRSSSTLGRALLILATSLCGLNAHADQKATVQEGSTVTLSVGANGTNPFSYQWKKGGTAITGATASSYTIPSVSAADAVSFSVVVSNSAGSTTSDVATLIVEAPKSARNTPVVSPEAQPSSTYDGRGKPSIMLENKVTGQRVLWLMNGANNAYVAQGLNVGALDPVWHIAGSADFNGDGTMDVIVENTDSGERVIWVMGGSNGEKVVKAVNLGVLDNSWRIAGVADFNDDKKPDVLLENTVTGQRVLWLMAGANSEYVAVGLDLGSLDPAWRIVATADFNVDGKTDILLENAVSGQRVLWLMGGPNNAYVTQGVDLGVLDPVWQIVRASDFNADGSPDILLENVVTGQRVLWLMGGPNNAYVIEGLDLGVLDPTWSMVK